MSKRKEISILQCAYLNEISPNGFMPEFCVTVGKRRVIEHFDLRGYETLIHLEKVPRSMGKVIAECGLVKSVSEANRQGWDFDVPEGMSDWMVKDGFKKAWLTVYRYPEGL